VAVGVGERVAVGSGIVAVGTGLGGDNARGSTLTASEVAERSMIIIQTGRGACQAQDGEGKKQPTYSNSYRGGPHDSQKARRRSRTCQLVGRWLERRPGNGARNMPAMAESPNAMLERAVEVAVVAHAGQVDKNGEA
jgi:hypothetical protein